MILSCHPANEGTLVRIPCHVLFLEGKKLSLRLTLLSLLGTHGPSYKIAYPDFLPLVRYLPIDWEFTPFGRAITYLKGKLKRKLHRRQQKKQSKQKHVGLRVSLPNSRHKEREMERIREKVSKMTKGHQRRRRGPRAQDKRQKGKLKTYSLR